MYIFHLETVRNDFREKIASIIGYYWFGKLQRIIFFPQRNIFPSGYLIDAFIIFTCLLRWGRFRKFCGKISPSSSNAPTLRMSDRYVCIYVYLYNINILHSVPRYTFGRRQLLNLRNSAARSARAHVQFIIVREAPVRGIAQRACTRKPDFPVKATAK